MSQLRELFHFTLHWLRLPEINLEKLSQVKVYDRLQEQGPAHQQSCLEQQHIYELKNLLKRDMQLNHL